MLFLLLIGYHLFLICSQYYLFHFFVRLPEFDPIYISYCASLGVCIIIDFKARFTCGMMRIYFRPWCSRSRFRLYASSGLSFSLSTRNFHSPACFPGDTLDWHPDIVDASSCFFASGEVPSWVTHILSRERCSICLFAAIASTCALCTPRRAQESYPWLIFDTCG